MSNNSKIKAEPNDIQKTQEQIRETLSKRITLKESIDILQTNLTTLENKYLRKQSGFFKLFTSKETINDIGIEIEETRTELKKQQELLSYAIIDINGLYTDIDESKYNNLVSIFEQVSKSDKIWNIVSVKQNTETKSSVNNHVDRTEVYFSTTSIEVIDSKFKALFLKNLNGPDLFLYPCFLIQFFNNGDILLTDIKEITFEFRQQRFIEPKISIPSDSKIIDNVWERVNKDGSPDLRFKGNFQTPVVKYGLFEFKNLNGIDVIYHVSNYEISEKFANNFISILKFNSSTRPYPSIPKVYTDNYDFSKHYYDLLIEFTSELKRITKKLSSDAFLTNKFQTILDDMPSFISYCVTYDLCQVAKALNDGDYDIDKLETSGLILATNQIFGNNGSGFIEEDYETVAISHSKGFYKDIANIIIGIGNKDNPLKIDMSYIENNELSTQTTLNSKFALPHALKVIDHPLFDEYVAMLFRFANIIAKADNHISKDEERRLKEIYKVTHYPITEQTNKSLIVSNSNESIDEILNELDSLIGLNGVKQEIKTLINFIKIQKAREASGLKSSNISYHIVFTGNPGTGKTTVARIIAKVYKALGILSQGQLVETDRSGLIAEYIGQTAIKVNNIVDSAINGVLFIDEAYSIAGETQNDYGKEAIATLIKRMEDDRDKLIVIIAGYTHEMNKFIETNPGLKSRFNRYIEFVDYSPQELFDIYQSQCSRLEYKLTDDAKVRLKVVFEEAYKERNKSFGNGRFVRNIFEKSLERQANRISSVASLDKEILITINEEDIP